MIIGLVSALALVAAACSSEDGEAGADGAPTVEITTPTDGAQVGRSFDVDLAINFPIGEPDTGRDHVHLYYDGNTADGEYGIAYEDTFAVSGLPPGEHEIQAVVAHADHSITDSRSEVVTVAIGAAGPGNDATSTPPPADDEDFGY